MKGRQHWHRSPVRYELDDALDAWVAETVQRALAFAVTLVRNRADAEDIVHDCYGRLLARSDEYDLPRDGTKLLFKAVANACINWVQRRPPVVSIEAAEQGPGGGSDSLADESAGRPESRAMYRELEDAVAGALAELPETQRAVVELRSLGHSLVEVADMLELSHTNARVLLHRARQSLAQRLRSFIEENVT